MNVPSHIEEDAARTAAQIESAAEAVLEGKQLLIDLDRRANATREAINALKQKRVLPTVPSSSSQQQNNNMNSSNNNLPSSLFKKPRIDGYQPPLSSVAANSSLASSYGNNKQVFLLCNGGTFVQYSKKESLERLAQDQNNTAISVDEARDALKEAVAELARLEGPDSALAKLHAGFDLKSFNK